MIYNDYNIFFKGNAMKKYLAIFVAVSMLFSMFSYRFVYADNLEGKTKAGELVQGEFFEYGYYPQSKVTDKGLIVKLNSVNVTLKSYGYLYDNSIDCGMTYGDFEYEGKLYRKVYLGGFREIEESRSPGIASNLPQYKFGYRTGSTYYFEWEPIKWVVMNVGDTVLARSSLILDSQPYNRVCQNNLYYKESTIRAWLNNSFYNIAFSENEHTQLVETTVENHENAYNNCFGGEDTLDKVWLLSYYDFKDENGFEESRNNLYHPITEECVTEYSKIQGLNYGTQFSVWLRDIGNSMGGAVTRGDFGYNTPYQMASQSASISYTTYGILPVIALNKNADISKSETPSIPTSDNSTENTGNTDNTGSSDNFEASCTHRSVYEVAVKKADYYNYGTKNIVCEKCKKIISTERVPKLKSVSINNRTFFYTGKTVNPSIAVKSDNGALGESDYSVEYISRATGKKENSIINVGQYKIVVTLKNFYQGSKTFYISVKPQTPQLLKSFSKKKKINLRWRKVQSIDGYQISVSKNKNFKNAKIYNVKSSASSKAINKLKKGKKYFVKVRAYKVVYVDGVKAYMYSSWSQNQKVKIK